MFNHVYLLTDAVLKSSMEMVTEEVVGVHRSMAARHHFLGPFGRAGRGLHRTERRHGSDVGRRGVPRGTRRGRREQRRPRRNLWNLHVWVKQ